MLELISIHIAKTAGRSFYEILRNEYGDALDPRFKRRHYFPDRENTAGLIHRIPDHIRVMHGHLLYTDIREIHLALKPKIITWMRDPVERVISNYYFLMKQLREDPRHPQARKIDYTLLEYARDSRKNKMSLYLEGTGPEALFFIGFLDSFRQDLEELARMLGWKNSLPEIHLNKSGNAGDEESYPTRRSEITGAMREEIRALNQQDVTLFERARAVRRNVTMAR